MIRKTNSMGMAALAVPALTVLILAAPAAAGERVRAVVGVPVQGGDGVQRTMDDMARRQDEARRECQALTRKLGKARAAETEECRIADTDRDNDPNASAATQWMRYGQQ